MTQNALLRSTLILGISVTPLVAGHNAALADNVIDDVGLRVGGYGFRETTDAQPTASGSTTGWEACRMDGLGVFVQRDQTKHFFFEGAVDTYFTDSFPMEESTGNYDTPIDRVSGIFTVAAGARFFPDSILTPYVQVGIGGEVTRVRLPELGLEKTAVHPMGFFGVGASLAVDERLRLGAAMRVNAMGYYDDAQFQTEMEAETELATQGQFFAKFAL